MTALRCYLYTQGTNAWFTCIKMGDTSRSLVFKVTLGIAAAGVLGGLISTYYRAKSRSTPENSNEADQTVFIRKTKQEKKIDRYYKSKEVSTRTWPSYSCLCLISHLDELLIDLGHICTLAQHFKKRDLMRKERRQLNKPQYSEEQIEFNRTRRAEEVKQMRERIAAVHALDVRPVSSDGALSPVGSAFHHRCVRLSNSLEVFVRATSHHTSAWPST